MGLSSGLTKKVRSRGPKKIKAGQTDDGERPAMGDGVDGTSSYPPINVCTRGGIPEMISFCILLLRANAIVNMCIAPIGTARQEQLLG